MKRDKRGLLKDVLILTMTILWGLVGLCASIVAIANAEVLPDSKLIAMNGISAIAILASIVCWYMFGNIERKRRHEE